jgi:hypothetical protein
MDYGILENTNSRALFEEINKRPHCGNCWFQRSAFETKDKKRHDCRSNLVPGFSSGKISIPIDVLIVGEAHGGGEDDDFREQRELDFEVSKMARFYRCLPDKTFHQQQVRILLEKLDKAGKRWVFTDLIKCFVWHGLDKDKKLDSTKNWEAAIKHCSKYLEEQIGLLQPRKILGLGRTVAQYYFRVDKPEHGSIYSISVNGHRTIYVHSLFPSQRTADWWAAKNGWEPVIPKLTE